MPLITILTAAHISAKPYLSETADSVLAQRLPDDWDFEWIIQGDGEKADELRDVLPNDTRISFEADFDVTLGPGPARNLALARASGRYVQTLDADDLLLANGLSSILEAIQDQPDIHWAFGQADDLMPDGNRVSFDPWIPPPGRMPAGRLSGWIDDHGGNVPVPCAGVMYRTTTLRALGGWLALPIGEDIALLAAASELTDGWQVPETTWLYRQHPAQISRHEAQPLWGTRARQIALQRISALSLTSASITGTADETNHSPTPAEAMKKPVII